jgi:DNA-binding NtrC family response regulator
MLPNTLRITPHAGTTFFNSMPKNSMQTGAVWIVDDDDDDKDLLTEVFKELQLPNDLVFLNNGTQLLERLSEVDEAPFVILCDVNLPGTDGFELREMMINSSNKNFQSVPFIFWSTHATEAQIEKAYRLRAHGFFIKEIKYDEWKSTFVNIIQYWQKSRIPSK